MASTKLIIVLAVITIVSFSIVAATDHIVGDESGWTGNYDYEAWANNRTFYVGDKLVFKYKIDRHVVFVVNATSYQDCIVPPFNEAWASGNDILTLTSPGKKWYICGMLPNHCATLGMRLAITVLERTAPAQAPTTSSAFAMLTSWSQVFAVVASFAVVVA